MSRPPVKVTTRWDPGGQREEGAVMEALDDDEVGPGLHGGRF